MKHNVIAFALIVVLVLIVIVVATPRVSASGMRQGIVPSPTPTPVWDKSSLEFVGADCGPDYVQATIKNVGDGDMAGESTWELWFSAQGNPKQGERVAFGSFGPLAAGEETTIVVNVSRVGNYMFRAYQRPGHPGDCGDPPELCDLWSEGIHGPCPTAVVISSFTVAMENGAVVVRWETASEINNVGFNLYRSTDGSLGQKLNASLIPSKSPGSGMGASYDFTDETALPGATYYYTLEDVDASGVRSQFGPIEFAVPASPTPEPIVPPPMPEPTQPPIAPPEASPAPVATTVTATSVVVPQAPVAPTQPLAILPDTGGSEQAWVGKAMLLAMAVVAIGLIIRWLASVRARRQVK